MKIRIEKKEEIFLDVEDMLYNEKKNEEERDRMRRKVVPIVEKANANRRDNLTEKERRGIRKLKDRKDIVIQGVDKGGATAIMEIG